MGKVIIDGVEYIPKPDAKKSGKITDRVKTFEDALDITDISPSLRDLISYTGNNSTMLFAQAAAKLSIIAEALNEGWKPNWDNSNEYKYYPWLYMDSARGFSLYYVYYNYTDSSVGSRLCFKSEELAKYAVSQFFSIYKDFFTIK